DEVSAAFARSVPRSAVLAATAFSSRAGTDPDGSGGPFGFDRTGAVEPGRGAGLCAVRRAAGANTSAAENITTTGDTGRNAGGGRERAAEAARGPNLRASACQSGSKALPGSIWRTGPDGP